MKNDIEAQPEWCGELAGQGIACRLLSDYMDVSKLSGYLLKPAAMLLSSFREILYLDADSNAIRNPDTHKNVPRERSDTLARLLEKHRVPHDRLHHRRQEIHGSTTSIKDANRRIGTNTWGQASTLEVGHHTYPLLYPPSITS
ncbi:MAG: hypothetical protein FRX48_04299 [Lasallia pustulata]|uniref:Uncharacterized protein n=1 Tax=Lasallia pustulata TaxID=136370 RepID=A0A5M8PT55_9LECA|nr:MAG: hypothetical protein FRX48_04299 [Lasallia pustulata]